MHHTGKVTLEDKITGKPFHAQCSCGTAGDFKQKSEASDYLTNHFARLQGISTTELVDTTEKVEEVAATPKKKGSKE